MLGRRLSNWLGSHSFRAVDVRDLRRFRRRRRTQGAPRWKDRCGADGEGAGIAGRSAENRTGRRAGGKAAGLTARDCAIDADPQARASCDAGQETSAVANV
jgi:hypothetical protein